MSRIVFVLGENRNMRDHIHPPARQLLEKARASKKQYFGEISAAPYVLFYFPIFRVVGHVRWHCGVSAMSTAQTNLASPAVDAFKQVPEPRG